MLSSILSIFGLGQKHTHAVSAKYSEATKLNAEFELNLYNTIELLRSEHLHLRHRIAAICEAVLHRSTATRNAPNPRRNSCGTSKTWTAESGHPVENSDANLGFCFLIFEGARL